MVLAARAIILSLLLWVLPAVAQVSSAFTVPPLSGPVVDNANLLNPSTSQRLAQALRALNDSGGSQIAVLTVESLSGNAIEPAAMKVAETWGLGKASTDRGVLLMVAKEERKVRIEVGQGNEGTLTDANSNRIIDQVIAPLFRSGQFDDGIILGIDRIVQLTDPDFNFQGYFRSGQPRQIQSERGLPISTWFFIALFIFILLSGFGRPRRGLGRYRRSGIGFFPGGFGGGGRGGFGGGGFGGGGGGFSGGGASGDW